MAAFAIPPPFSAGGGGVLPDPHDDRDHYYDPAPISLPPSKDLRPSGQAGVTPFIYNQYQTGSCVANAAAAALWFEEKAGRREGNWGDKGPSRLFIYWIARAFGFSDADDTFTAKNAEDGGSYTRKAMKAISKRGACPEADCPFPDFPAIYAKLQAQGVKPLTAAAIKGMSDPIVNCKPSKTAYDDAVPHQITNYYRIDLNRPDQTASTIGPAERAASGQDCLRKAKQCIAEGFPVAFSYYYYLPGELLYEHDTTGNYNYINENGEKKPMIKLRDIWAGPTHDPNSKPPRDLTFERHSFVDPNLTFQDKDGNAVELGGHAVLAIGYDEHYFFVQNSWGKKWGGGVFLVPYSWISDYAATIDFWTIRVEPIAHAKPMAAPVLWEQIQEQLQTQV